MKNKSGFTLVELLAVIVLLAIIMAIAVPSALKLSTRVKESAYKTKIGLIEASAKIYGQSNIGFVKKGTNPKNIDQHYTCKFVYNDKKEVASVTYTFQAGGYSETKELAANEYWCIRTNVADLVGSGDLKWDTENACKDKCTTSNRQYYDNIITNPTTNYIINKCYVYVYYKYNNVYTAFDEVTCSNRSDVVTDGHEYKPLT